VENGEDRGRRTCETEILREQAIENKQYHFSISINSTMLKIKRDDRWLEIQSNTKHHIFAETENTVSLL
jgi:hypothetical protein